MEFGIALRNLNCIIQLGNYSIKIIDGNWGVFRESFTNHVHSYYELHYVSGGRGTLITDTITMPLKKGCFYLLPPRTNHEQWSDPNGFLQEYHLAFELICRPTKDIIWERLFSPVCYDAQRDDLEVFFENIAQETNQKQYGYRDIICQNIQSILIQLIRSIPDNGTTAAAPPFSLDDKRFMIIDEAFLYQYTDVTLSSLSCQLKLSARQTQRFIQNKYGVSFSALKFRSRLSHAAMLLSTTELTLGEICARIGYKNYSFFSRAFKQRYEMTPVVYRKSHHHM